MNIQETSTAGSRTPVRASGKTVLIVEDNELNMKLFHDILAAHGYTTMSLLAGIGRRSS